MPVGFLYLLKLKYLCGRYRKRDADLPRSPQIENFMGFGIGFFSMLLALTREYENSQILKVFNVGGGS